MFRSMLRPVMRSFVGASVTAVKTPVVNASVRAFQTSSSAWRRGMWAMGAAGAAALAVGAGGMTQLDDSVAPAATLTPERVLATSSFGSRDDEVVWKKQKDNMKIFTGNSNRDLAAEIAGLLNRKLGHMKVGRFADGEVNVQVYETVRGKDIYIVQPTCQPVNESLMELFLMVSTMRRASARKITVVIPYYGYARQDRKMTARVPISAADVARLLEAMGVDRVVAVDLHCGQIQGFFGPRVPVDNLDAGVIGVKYFAKKALHEPVIVSPDAGGVYRAKKFGEGLKNLTNQDPGLAMIIKQRRKAGEVESMNLVGSVDGSDVIIVDDMIDTAGTLCKAAQELKNNGARRVFAFASHGLFSGPAFNRIKNSCLEEVVTVNTVPLKAGAENIPQLKQLSVAPLIAETIDRIHKKKSISRLFGDVDSE